MRGPTNVKSPNNNSKWQMGFNSAFKGLKSKESENETGKIVSLHLYKYIFICSLYVLIMFILGSRCLSLHNALLAGQIWKKTLSQLPHLLL
jgi:hypothetical protein